MIKGAHKEMIVIRTGSSRYFDEAYFVLRENAQKEKQKSKSILEEANRILAEISPEAPTLPQKKSRNWIFFWIGSICGAALSVVLTLLFV